VWSLLALAVGLAAGAVLHGFPDSRANLLVDWVSPIGQMWVTLLRMTVFPLVITQMFVAVMKSQGHGSIATLGGKAILVFVALLLLAGLFSIVTAPPLIALFPTSPETASSLLAGTVVPEAARAASQGGHTSISGWLIDLIPANVFASVAGDQILPLLIFTVLFALAATRLPAEQRDLLHRIGQALAEATMVLVRWIMVLTPLGVFALAFVMAAGAGITAAGYMGAFVVISCILMIVFTIILYPLTAIVGRVSVRRFARAVAPAQVVAAGSRSSIAALPAMVEGARDELKLPPVATGFILPFAVSIFKLNGTITGPVRLLFVAHVFGISLSATGIATFLVTIVIMTFSRVGVPGGGSAFRSLPAYLALGLPIEGIVILEAVDAIPDIFKTIINVTGDMSAAAILSRGDRAMATA
jgi:proton glutamate symport protein